MRRGFFFTIDGFLAATLLIAALLVITQHVNPSTPQQETVRLSQDAVQALSAIKMKEIQDPWVQSNIADGTIDDPESSVVVQLGKFWALNLSTEALQLSTIVLDDVLPPGFHLSVQLEDELLYNTTGATPLQVASARRMISGVAKGEALTGNTGSASLQSVTGKNTNSFAFFGGFVGQGNVTAVLSDLPSDINSSNIREVLLEGEFDDDFDVLINDVVCEGPYAASSGDLDILSYNLSHNCYDDFAPGDNVIELRFASINGSISGGFLRVSYVTDEFGSPINASNQAVYLPGIEGIINMYDGLSVPGELVNLSLYIHYEVFDEPRTIFFDIGNVTVYDANISGEHTITLTDSYLKSRLDFDIFDNSTVPYRFGYFDGNTTNTSGNISDVMLLTSRHNSMGTEDIEVSPGVFRSRMEQVKIVDKLFVNIVLGNLGNRVGLVSFGTGASVDLDSDVTTDNATLQAIIDGYAEHPAAAQRNLCGALEEAKEELLNEPSGRNHAIMFMTDGDILKPTGNTPRCDGSPTNDLDLLWADVVQQACDFVDPVHGNPENITFYAVAFGPEAAASPHIKGNLSLMANCTGGQFAVGENATDLEDIYEEFATNISASSVVFEFQRITAAEGVASDLYADSFFNMTYTSSIPSPGPTQLAITFQTEPFGSCTPTINIPTEMEVWGGVLNSYSGDFWTKTVAVDGVALYNLSAYGETYAALGDPARIYVPGTYLTPGSHVFDMRLGANATVDEDCSLDNSLIYYALINTTVSRGTVLPNAIGCHWTIEFEDGQFMNASIPGGYNGTKECSYTNASISYDPTDSYDEVVFRLFEKLDFDNDGRVFVNLEASDLEVIVTIVSDVPYLWGPSMARVVVSR